MALQKYVAKSPEQSCRRCNRGFKVFRPMRAKPLETCRFCGSEVRISIQPVAIKVAQALKGTGHEYRSDLARYPGDPRAHVSGPHSLARLVETTKREGADVSKTPPTLRQPVAPRTDEEIAGEAYRKAKAKGFRTDAEIAESE